MRATLGTNIVPSVRGEERYIRRIPKSESSV